MASSVRLAGCSGSGSSGVTGTMLPMSSPVRLVGADGSDLAVDDASGLDGAVTVPPSMGRGLCCV